MSICTIHLVAHRWRNTTDLFGAQAGVAGVSISILNEPSRVLKLPTENLINFVINVGERLPRIFSLQVVSKGSQGIR